MNNRQPDPQWVALILSAVTGCMFGLTWWVILLLLNEPQPERWALIMGLSFFGFMLLWLMIQNILVERRYRKAEKALPGKPEAFFSANLMNNPRRPESLRLYICRERLALVPLNRRGQDVTVIAPGEIKSVDILDRMMLLLTLHNGSTFKLMTADASGLLEALRREHLLP